MHTVLVLGGYGFFGERIAMSLADVPDVNLLIGGRNHARAVGLARRLGLTDNHGIRIDASSSDCATLLRSSGVETLIHTAGPFQDQGYTVAASAVEAGCNYIDLADGREFVGGISVLDGAARKNGVAVISGASSVPGLSSAVVDHYAPAFDAIESVRLGIGSGARAPGLATVRAVFGYCGKPIRRLENGDWVETFGWLDLLRYEFPHPVGRRWMGSCDVPDLDLIPKRFNSVKTVTFHAGFASDLGHLFVWVMASLVKAGIMGSMGFLARPLHRISRWIERFVSDKGAMFVEIEGVGRDKQPVRKRWHIVANQNHGPYIPCGAAIALACKIARGDEIEPGARPCLDLLSVEEYLAPLRSLDLRVVADAIR